MDIEKELSKALSDPNIMEKVSGVLSSLGNSNPKEENEDKSDKGAVDMSNLSGLLQGLGGAVNDDRTRLLLAIKPFLSSKRAPYMDSAITILKLASMGKIGKDLKLF